MSDHVTRNILYKGEPVQIDEGIADLIQAVWRMGIDTKFCCEGGAYISFGSVMDAMRFLTIAHAGDSSLGIGELSTWWAGLRPKPDEWSWIPEGGYGGVPVYFHSRHVARLTEIFCQNPVAGSAARSSA